MTRRSFGVAALVLVLIGLAAGLIFSRRETAPAPAQPGLPAAAPAEPGPGRGVAGMSSASGTPAATARPSPAAVLAQLANTIGPDSISPIAADLNAPGGNIRRDLEIMDELFTAWRTNFPRAGNPIGDNDEITCALAGANPLQFAFVAPTHRAINPRGELCDRWGTPFRFHALSGTQMEIRSAGPDLRFATDDDVQFAAAGNRP